MSDEIKGGEEGERGRGEGGRGEVGRGEGGIGGRRGRGGEEDVGEVGLSSIYEEDGDESFDSEEDGSLSTLRPIHSRANSILERIRTLNPSLQPPSSPT